MRKCIGRIIYLILIFAVYKNVVLLRERYIPTKTFIISPTPVDTMPGDMLLYGWKHRGGGDVIVETFLRDVLYDDNYIIAIQDKRRKFPGEIYYYVINIAEYVASPEGKGIETVIGPIDSDSLDVVVKEKGIDTLSMKNKRGHRWWE